MNWYDFKRKVLSHLSSGYSTVLLMDMYCKFYSPGQSTLEHSKPKNPFYKAILVCFNTKIWEIW